jgi:guanylate kinase
MLVEEFPDVFDLPRQHTTRPPDLHSRHMGMDGDELQLVAEQPGSAGSSSGGAGTSVGQAAAARPAGPDPGLLSKSSSGAGAGENSSSKGVVLGPPPRVVSEEEFDAAVVSGQLLEHHQDLFTHPLAVHRHGHSLDDLQAIIKAGKLPLLELEAEQTELLKVTKSVDCLSIFLAPPSLTEHQQRLEQAVTETVEEVADRGAVAAAELAAVKSQSVFDQVLVNDELEEGYQQLKAAISKFRPDIIPPATDESAARAAQQAAANTPVPLLVAGPAGNHTYRQHAAAIVLVRAIDSNLR